MYMYSKIHCNAVNACGNGMWQLGSKVLIPIVFRLINISEYFSVYGDSDSTSINPDDLLPPIHKLEKYAESDNIFNRYEMKQLPS